MRVISRERCPSRAAMASRRMPRLMAWVARVWRSWWGWTWSMPAVRPTRPTMRPTWWRAIGPRGAAVRGRGWGVEVGVEGDVAVVAELAERHAQPVGLADADDGVGGEIAEFAGA